MDTQAITNLITTVGFPIVCCLGLGWFMIKYINQQREDNINRENKLLELTSKQNEVLININSNMDKMSTTLENMNQRLDILEQKVDGR
jgi:Flp pilus assembly protein TadB